MSKVTVQEATWTVADDGSIRFEGLPAPTKVTVQTASWVRVGDNQTVELQPVR